MEFIVITIIPSLNKISPLCLISKELKYVHEANDIREKYAAMPIWTRKTGGSFDGYFRKEVNFAWIEGYKKRVSAHYSNILLQGDCYSDYDNGYESDDVCSNSSGESLVI